MMILLVMLDRALQILRPTVMWLGILVAAFAGTYQGLTWLLEGPDNITSMFGGALLLAGVYVGVWIALGFVYSVYPTQRKG